MIVADTSLIVHLLLRGERTSDAERAFHRDPSWAAPLLWRSEFRNVLATHQRTGSLELDLAMALMEDAEKLIGGQEYAVPSAEVLRTAASSGLSAYDCEFVVLARDLRVPLVTTDTGMMRSFPDLAISPEAFSGSS